MSCGSTHDIVTVQQDGESIDIDFLKQPKDSVWIGIHGVDVCIRRVKGAAGESDLLAVSVWEPGVVSSCSAELATDLKG